MKQKLVEMVQVTVLRHTDEFIFDRIGFKNGNGRQNSSSGAKTGYFDGRVPKLSSRVTLATSGAGVVCHMYIIYSTSRLSNI